jgi:diaminopimelate decarboxylase
MPGDTQPIFMQSDLVPPVIRASAEDAHPRRAGNSRFDGVDLAALALRIGTPCYAYSATAIRERIDALKSALGDLDALVCFAVKANPNIAVLQLMAQAGVGADIVSTGELRRALRAGIPADRIVFSGVGKTIQEINEALMAGVARFNLESRDELECLQRLAREHHVIAHAAVRVNPDVDAGTHAKISTGMAENKFGVSLAEARRWFAAREHFPHVRMDGLHVHIGSQILSVEPLRLAFARVAEFRRELAAGGHAITSIDVGGGLGVSYREGHDQPITPHAYVEAIRESFGDFAGRIVLEPGRWLVAEAGVLLTRVIRVKRGVESDFLVVDAAMNDLLRPALYGAFHEIVPVGHAPSLSRAGPLKSYDIVGPVCESSDIFARARELPGCAPGDLLMIKAAGAYGASMSSTFNSRPLAAEVLLDNGRYSIVRRRQTFEEMISGETLAADWQCT